MNRWNALFGVVLLGSAACSADVTGPHRDASLVVTFDGLSAIPAATGAYEVWVFGGGDTVSVGRIPAGAGAVASFEFVNPLDRPAGMLVTLQPPGTAGERRAAAMLHGLFSGAVAQLGIEGAVTDGRPLQESPGAHSLFTTSNNVELGYPSAENAGLWLFSVAPSRNVHGTREVKLTPLQRGWIYEGWIVRQTEPELWISYGKFRPDEMSLLRSRDDTGAGPFAGDEDFRNAGVEDVPGEEWTTDRVARQLGITMPDDVSLPLQLDALDSAGNPVWHHVITIEPAFDELEGPLEGRPFNLRPYQNAIGTGGPGEPRVIRLVNQGPTATVRFADR